MLKSPENICTPAVSKVLIYSTSNAITDEIPSTQLIITGVKTFIFCLIETMNIAAIVATKVAIIQGIKMSVGLAAFVDALNAIILTGIKVRPDA